MKKSLFLWIYVSILTLSAGFCASAQSLSEVGTFSEIPPVPLSERGNFNMNAWAQLPICRDGRIMPLDAFARTHVRLICGREAPKILFADGKRRKFSASELLFSWLTEPEAWEEVDFFPLENETIREWMDLRIFDDSGNRLSTVSPSQLSRAFNTVAFNEKLARLQETLETSEAQRKEESALKEIKSEKKDKTKKNQKLLQDLQTLESRYVTWLRLTMNPVRYMEPEGSNILCDAAHVSYLQNIVTVSFVEQNVVFFFCNSYEPELSFRGTDLNQISKESKLLLGSERQILDVSGRKFSPREFYTSLRQHTDLWECVPFIFLESVEVRRFLGLPVATIGENPILYVSPSDLKTSFSRILDLKISGKSLSETAHGELQRLRLCLNLYYTMRNGDSSDFVPLGERFYSDYQALRECWFGVMGASRMPSQPLDLQLLLVCLQRSQPLFQKIRLGWRNVSEHADLNSVLESGVVSEKQWEFLLSCMDENSPERALFTALHRITLMFREVDVVLERKAESSMTLEEAETRVKLLSRKLMELRIAVEGVRAPLDDYCQSARKWMSTPPSQSDSEWYSYLVISRIALRNFSACVSSLPYTVFDDELSICVLPAVEGVPLDRNRTESVQIFGRVYPLHSQPWLSLNALRFGDLEDGFAASWPDAGRKGMKEALQSFRKMEAAWKRNDPDAFRAESVRWSSKLRQTASALEAARATSLPEERMDVEALAQTQYPASSTRMQMETVYSAFRPFTWAWVMTFISTLILGAASFFEILARKKCGDEADSTRSADLADPACSAYSTYSAYSADSDDSDDSIRSVFESLGNLAFWLGFGFLLLGILASTIGLGMRSWIMNRAPVTNMFETIVFVAWSAGVLGVFLTFRSTFAQMFSLGWNAVKFSSNSDFAEENQLSKVGVNQGPISDPESSNLFFRLIFWVLRGALAVAFLSLLCFYGLGNGGGYTAIQLLPARAVGATMPSLSAVVEWISGILMLAVFLWWAPLFLLAPVAGFCQILSRCVCSETTKRMVSTEAQRMHQRFQRPFFAGATALVVFVISYISVSFPDVFKSDLRNLAPILRDNYWLAVHVVTIVASYGAGMLAWGLANGALCCYLFGRYRTVNGKVLPPEICTTLTELLYRCMQAAVLLLVIGTILGGLWADVSWGKFWSWDRKEVWALISLFVYLLILHGRYVRLLGEFTLAIGSVLGAFAIVMAWYGVNYVIGSAQHGYGAGTGSLFYAGVIVGLNCLLILGAVIRYVLACICSSPEDEI